MMTDEKISFQPVTMDRWNDFVELFGPKGAYAGCWCMWWRLPRKEFEQSQGEKNKQSMKAIVDSGRIPGLIAYVGDIPAGWCSVAPREHYPVLERSRVMKRLDDQPVWSIVCFFIKKEFRGRNLGMNLVRAAIDFVKSRGGTIIEAYPTAPKGKKLPPVSSFMGLPDIFAKAGFQECARPSESRVIMRYYIRD